jgi:SAM-dependent methyltransferase
MAELPEAIYQRPDDYDLEHLGDMADVEFFVALMHRLRPRRMLELACGNGRVTLPLAEAGAQDGFEVVGLELVPEMLQAARRKSAALSPDGQARLTLVEGDMRSWRSAEPFDLIITPCSSVSHLLTLDEQLATWRRAYENLVPGGRFVVHVVMADLGAYADSFRRPAREVVEIDRDTYDEASHTRLLRYKTTRYLAHQQRARIRFLYEKYVGDAQPEHSISDYESHVYYPRELELLYRSTGFEIETVYGDYQGRPPQATSSQLIWVGQKPSNATTEAGDPPSG